MMEGGREGGIRDGWRDGGTDACFLQRSLALPLCLPLLWNLYRASVRFFCPPKVQIHVEELLLLFFILAAQIQTSVRVCLSDRRRGPNDDGDDEARRSPRARGSSPCAKCAAVILSRSRMPKRGFLLRNRHPGHRVKTILWPRPAAGVATTLGGGMFGAVKLIHPHDLMVSGL